MREAINEDEGGNQRGTQLLGAHLMREAITEDEGGNQRGTQLLGAPMACKWAGHQMQSTKMREAINEARMDRWVVAPSWALTPNWYSAPCWALGTALGDPFEAPSSARQRSSPR